MESEIRRLVLQDPDYIEEHGLSIVHFTCDRPDAPKPQQYMMLNKIGGKKSKTVFETWVETKQESKTILEAFMTWIKTIFKIKPTELQQREEHNLAEFSRPLVDMEIRIQRRKHASERLRWALEYDKATGDPMSRPYMIGVWRAALFLSGCALVAFYGVGVIATNTTFSPLFQQYFFWIAIVWSLASSSLLGWLVSILGASKRDVLGSFLSALALWLVIIQVRLYPLLGPRAYQHE